MKNSRVTKDGYYDRQGAFWSWEAIDDLFKMAHYLKSAVSLANYLATERADDKNNYLQD
jgi:hypothetical protein